MRKPLRSLFAIPPTQKHLDFYAPCRLHSKSFDSWLLHMQRFNDPVFAQLQPSRSHSPSEQTRLSSNVRCHPPRLRSTDMLPMAGAARGSAARHPRAGRERAGALRAFGYSCRLCPRSCVLATHKAAGPVRVRQGSVLCHAGRCVRAGALLVCRAGCGRATAWHWLVPGTRIKLPGGNNLQRTARK